MKFDLEKIELWNNHIVDEKDKKGNLFLGEYFIATFGVDKCKNRFNCHFMDYICLEDFDLVLLSPDLAAKTAELRRFVYNNFSIVIFPVLDVARGILNHFMYAYGTIQKCNGEWIMQCGDTNSHVVAKIFLEDRTFEFKKWTKIEEKELKGKKK